MEKLFKWLVPIGLILIILGFIALSIAGHWSALVIILIALGGLSVLAMVVLRFQTVKTWFTKRSTVYGGNAVVMSLTVLGILVILNILLSNHTWRKDTTAAGQFSLADQTVKVLKGLDQDVKIMAFFKKLNKDAIDDRLKEYTHVSSKVKYEIIDPDESPEMAKMHKVRSYGTIVVISGDEEEKIEESTEEAITNAIIKVTRTEKKKIYFVTGHGEAGIDSKESGGYAQVSDLIKEQNYLVESLFLAEKDSIPGDASTVVIAGPKKEFFETEMKTLKKYIDKGGNTLFMLDPDGIGLNEFLKNWHIDVHNDVVVDVSGIGRLFGTGPAVPLVQSYGDHPIVKGFNFMTFFPITRSVSPSEDVKDAEGFEVKELGKTSRNSWGESSVDQVFSTGEVGFDRGKDLQGPLSIAVAASFDTKEKEDKKSKTRMVVIGDSDFATNAYLHNQGNADFFMNVISWLVQDEDLISIRPKNPENRTVSMNQAQMKTVFWLFVVILPAIIFGVGVLVYVRRK